ncbi:MAG: hypothetical protein V5A27_05790 [Halapricum sp.]
MKWLQSGRRRDICVLLYGTDGLPAQKLKTALERRYDDRIDPKQFYGGLEALERLGHVTSRTDSDCCKSVPGRPHDAVRSHR